MINILIWLILGVLIGWLGSTGDGPTRNWQFNLGLGLIGAMLGGLFFNGFDFAAIERSGSRLSLYELLLVGVGAIGMVTIGAMFQRGWGGRP